MLTMLRYKQRSLMAARMTRRHVWHIASIRGNRRGLGDVTTRLRDVRTLSRDLGDIH